MRAIDIHCHPSTASTTPRWAIFMAAFEALVGRTLEPKSEDGDGQRFPARRCARHDDRQRCRSPRPAAGIISNDWIAGLSERHPDVFLPGWAVVDPWRGKAAVNELERAFTTLGLTGAKWQPILQAFYPHDRRFYPIWDLCQSMGAPVLIHAGTTAIGSGMPGGGGLKLDHARPLPAIDCVAADFPRLTIVMAHPAWPWTEEAIAVLLHKSNVFMDISGWRPKYLPAPLKHEMSRRLQDKIVYGSDYPGWSPGQFLDELEMEGLKPPVIEKLFIKNATRILKLEAKVEKALAAQKARAARA